LQEYEQLLEDLHDLAVVAERREEPAMEFGEAQEAIQRLMPGSTILAGAISLFSSPGSRS